MRGKRYVLLPGLFLCLIGGTLAFVCGWFSGEPITHWRSVGSWTKDVVYQPWGWEAVNDNRRPKISEQPALKAIIPLGHRAVPVLFDTLIEYPILYGTNYFREKIRWVQWKTANFSLISEEPNVKQSIKQTKAGIVLMLIRKEDGGGVLPLLDAYDKAPMSYYADKNFRPWLCIREAVAISPDRASEYKEDLLTELGTTNQMIRAEAASALGLFPGFFEELIPKIISLERDKNVYVRLSAYKAHAYLVTNLKIIDPQLLRSLEHILTDTPLDETERSGAAQSLQLLGAGAEEALPILKSLTTQTNRSIRGSSYLAIRLIEKAINKEKGNKANKQ
ncbi:MAG: hypothetical protein JWM04_1229 [Verrucomicrobiales bacterium]|nr:hypothetical protein [Verrucomicrobiales bacterium]